MKWLCVALVALSLAGCATPPSEAPSANPKPAPPEVTASEKNPLYDQLHSGLFQADPAVKKLADAEDIARDLLGRVAPDLTETMKEMVGVLDDSGSSLNDLTAGDPPTLEQVNSDKNKYTQQRADLINQIGDILHDLREQEGVAADLSDSGPADLKPKFAKLDELLNHAIDDLVGALDALDPTLHKD